MNVTMPGTMAFSDRNDYWASSPKSLFFISAILSRQDECVF